MPLQSTVRLVDEIIIRSLVTGDENEVIPNRRLARTSDHYLIAVVLIKDGSTAQLSICETLRFDHHSEQHPHPLAEQRALRQICH